MRAFEIDSEEHLGFAITKAKGSTLTRSTVNGTWEEEAGHAS